MKIKIIQLISTLVLAGCTGSGEYAFEMTPVKTLIGSQPEKDQTNPPEPDVEAGEPSEELSYQNILATVLIPKCLKCHSEKGGNRGDLNLESYQNVFNNRDEIRNQIVLGKMPKKSTPMTEKQIALIVSWIDAGANEFDPNATPTTPPVVDPAPVNPDAPLPNEPYTLPAPVVPVDPLPNTPPDLVNLNYAGVFKIVIEPKCLKCHNANAKNGIELMNYENLLFYQQEIKKNIETNEMPKEDKLTLEEKKLILDWIVAGLPQD